MARADRRALGHQGTTPTPVVCATTPATASSPARYDEVSHWAGFTTSAIGRISSALRVPGPSLVPVTAN
jgi:hypothetical protein